MTEIWRPITNYNNYLISNLGNLKKTNGKIYNYTKNKMTVSGYMVTLSQNSKSSAPSVAQLVATEFVENPNNYRFIKFIDGDKTNPRATNLCWVKTPYTVVDPTATNVLKTFDTPIIAETPPEVDVPDMVTYSDDDFVTDNDKKELTKEKQLETENYVKKIKNIEVEIWRPINDFKYHVSNLGRVRKDDNQSILDGSFRSRAYYSVVLQKNSDERFAKQVHNLVAQAFLPNPYNHPIVNHLDGNKHNAHVKNLEWCTFTMNSKHAIETGLVKRDTSKGSPTAIYQMDSNDNIIGQFSSVKEAAEETKTNVKQILAYLTGTGTMTTTIHKWVYCEHHDGDHDDMHDDEEWKKVKDYPNYSVSNYGRVRNDRQREAGRPCLRVLYEHDGYSICGLSKDSKCTTLKVSRLVATAFIPNPQNLPFVDHINTIANDDRVVNLRWVDQKGNMNNELTLQKTRKEVSQCHAGTSKVIKTFKSLRDAADTLKVNIAHISTIANANRDGNWGTKGYRKQAGGFNWFFYEDIETLQAIEAEKQQSELQTPTPPKPKITLNLIRK